MKYHPSFDDVLLVPKFSMIESRKDVDTSSTFLGDKITTSIMSSNMDSVTGGAMATAMRENGGLAALHRFQTIEENVKMFASSPDLTYCSVGIGAKELERFEALFDSGCSRFILDVAHGASLNVVRQARKMRMLKGENFRLIVGNFATGQSINDFLYHEIAGDVDAFKIGIGSGSGCTTRVVTGAGLPTMASILDCKNAKYPIIADGGIKGSGDYSKALAGGADIVMLGRTLAGSDESLATPTYGGYGLYGGGVQTFLTTTHVDQLSGTLTVTPNTAYGTITRPIISKRYRGSASEESYTAQGKTAEHRTPEGESMDVPYSGPVKATLQKFDAGLRSAMSYVGAETLKEFKNKAEFAWVTGNGARENGAHGKL